MKPLSSNMQHFFKMQGSGNDFILWDNTALQLPRESMSIWAKTLCPRGFAIGADGMIFLEPSGLPDFDFIWHFFNADGSRAEMCGNGSRCAARLAYRLGLAGKEQVFGTDAGAIRAQVKDKGKVRVQLTSADNLQLHNLLNFVEDPPVNVHSVNTGVPHAVVICDDVQKVNVLGLGRQIRMHQDFSPAGTNVNFIQIKDRGHIFLRTFERGVENETFACGTGAAASVVVAAALGLCADSVQVITSGKELLNIELQDDSIFLTGKADFIYQGMVFLDTFGLDVPKSKS
ncbi:diaminopimelate epimerase [Desulfonatronospira sp.]|uniref:diaminopimelate epimerase n=1 Tax=Desulfonatronospira sp. TaxID=1962951 RepID=UPI0025C0E711|nr:diaminopimelate epimerase [Desulfonatronospira sp.]